MPCSPDLKYVLKATSKQTSTRQIFPHKIILRYYFFKSAQVYFTDGVVTHYFCHILYGKHVVKAGWWTVVRNTALGLVNLKKKLEIRTFFVRKTVIIF